MFPCNYLNGKEFLMIVLAEKVNRPYCKMGGLLRGWGFTLYLAQTPHADTTVQKKPSILFWKQIIVTFYINFL